MKTPHSDWCIGLSLQQKMIEFRVGPISTCTKTLHCTHQNNQYEMNMKFGIETSTLQNIQVVDSVDEGGPCFCDVAILGYYSTEE